MGDVPVEVALQHRRPARGGPAVGRGDRRACGGWTSPASGSTAWTRPPAIDRSWAPRTAGRGGAERDRGAGGGRPGRAGRARPETGGTALRVPIEQDRPENRANDVKVDGRGRAWVGTMAYDKRPRQRRAVPRRRRRGDPRGRRTDDLQRPGVRRVRGGACTWPTPRCSSSTSSTWTRHGGALRSSAVPRPHRAAALAGRHDRRRRRHVLGGARARAGAVHRYRPDGTLDGVVEVPTSQPDVGGLRRRRRRRPLHHHLLGRLRAAAPPSPWPARSSGAVPARPGGPRRGYGRPSPARAQRLPASPTKKAIPMIEQMVLFGASGDLTSRLLMPAVAQLAEAGLLPPGSDDRRRGQHRVVAPRTSAGTSPRKLEEHARGARPPPATPWCACSTSARRRHQRRGRRAG